MSKTAKVLACTAAGLAGASIAGGAYFNNYLHDADRLGELPEESFDPEIKDRYESYLCFSNVKIEECNHTNDLATIGSGGNRIYRPLDQISPHLMHAMLAAEDRRFFLHDGVDNKGVARAIAVNGWKSFTDLAIDQELRVEFEQGASTIPMQVADWWYRNAPDRPPTDDKIGLKYWEAQMALKLKRDYTDTQLLEMYPNNLNYGRGAYSAEVAAIAYFGVSARDLTVPQAATLAAVINNPAGLEGSQNTQRDLDQQTALKARRDKIINDMAESKELIAYGYPTLTADQVREYQAVPLGILPYHIYDSSADTDYEIADALGALHYVDMVMSEIAAKSNYSRREQGMNLRFMTTLDYDVQAAVNDAVKNGPYPRDGREIGAVVMRQDGAVLGMSGGDYSVSQTNLATQPVVNGSLQKPFMAYLPAFENGSITLDMEYPDQLPFIWEGGGENGTDYIVDTGANCEQPICHSIAEAMAESSNPVALQIAENGGMAHLKRGRALMEAFGAHSDSPIVPSNVLGSAETSLYGNVTMYNGLLANRGAAVTPRILESVWAVENNQLVNKWQAPGSSPEQIVAPEVADMVIEGLRGTAVYGTASGQLGDFPEGVDLALKTGTHDDNVAATIVGSTVVNNGSEEYNVTIGILERYRDTLDRSMGTDSDGGNHPAALFEIIARSMIDQPGRLND